MEIIIHRSCVVLHDVFNSICVVKFFRTFSKCSRIYTHTTTLFSNLSFPSNLDTKWSSFGIFGLKDRKKRGGGRQIN